jgi:hypothetical protein
MKRTCLAILMCCLLPGAAFAAPCLPGSLASYIALGAGGCSIGAAQFFNFTNLPPNVSGAATIPDSVAFVSPLDESSPGLRFNVNSGATANTLLERVIGFSLSGSGFTGNHVSLSGNSVTLDGAITAVEDKCLGAAFAAGPFCPAASATLTAYDLGLLGESLDPSLSFAAVTSLGVIVDITVDGGTSGSANLKSVTAQFTPVPEPATMTLVGIGLAAGIGSQRRRRSTAECRSHPGCGPSTNCGI